MGDDPARCRSRAIPCLQSHTRLVHRSQGGPLGRPEKGNHRGLPLPIRHRGAKPPCTKVMWADLVNGKFCRSRSSASLFSYPTENHCLTAAKVSGSSWHLNGNDTVCKVSCRTRHCAPYHPRAVSAFCRSKSLSSSHKSRTASALHSFTPNRDRGEPRGSRPPTPPDVRGT